MCMEDVDISRQTRTSQQTIATTGSDQNLCPSDPTRVAIVFGSPTTDSVWITTTGVAVVGEGLLIRATDPPLQLDIYHSGQMVRKEWRIIPTLGTPSITTFLTSLPIGKINPQTPR